MKIHVEQFKRALVEHSRAESGHLISDGERVMISGVELTMLQVAAAVKFGAPDHAVISTCGVQGCVLPAHLVSDPRGSIVEVEEDAADDAAVEEYSRLTLADIVRRLRAMGRLTGSNY